MNVKEELEKLSQEKSDLQAKKAVADAKIKELCEKLGIKPSISEVKEAQESLKKEISDNEASIKELMDQYESLSHGSESEE